MASRRFSGSRVITASRGGEEEEVQGQGQGQGLMSPKGNGKKYKTGTLQANQRPGESKSSKDSNGSMVISKSELTVLKQLLSSKEQQIQQALKSAAGSSVKSQGSMVISKAELTVLKQLLATKDQEIQTLKTVDQSQGRNGSMNISKAELTVLKQLLATKDQEIQALKTEAGSVQSKGSDGSMNISKAELALLKNLLATKEQQIQALKTAADVPPPSSQSKNRSARKEAEDGTSVAANARALRAATADLLAAGKEQQIQALKAAAESVQSQGDASIDVSKAELTVLKQLLAAKEQQIQQALITAAEVGPPSPKSKGSRPPKGGSPRNDPIENTPSPTSASKAIKVANAKMAEQLAAMQQQLRDVAAALDVSKASQSRLAKQEKALEMQIRKLNAN
ncbi:hypothetical protein B484DRAFT_226017 [Ochromonadaceae sp. CCMP2298]|nr:hypothetical protein B484DRAFT_226017 [Ochromonadaceae sp. CCMP2298]